jgi:hypothetical protein
VPPLDASAKAAVLPQADLPADKRAERRAMGQDNVEIPHVHQQVHSAATTEDVVEAYLVPARLTDALVARTGAGIVMGSRSISNDGTVSGSRRPSGSISSMVIATNELPLARMISAAEVNGAAARLRASSRAKNVKSAVQCGAACPSRDGVQDEAAQDQEEGDGAADRTAAHRATTSRPARGFTTGSCWPRPPGRPALLPIWGSPPSRCRRRSPA